MKPSLLKGNARTAGVLVLLTAVLTAGAPSVIRIRPGDTLSGLALAHHTSVSALKRANHLSGDLIFAGQLLRLPGNATPATHRVAPRTTDRVYVVRAGDNLTWVSARLHHSLPWLKARNHLRDSTIYIGQRLVYSVPVAHQSSAAGGPGVSAGVSRSVAHHRAVLAQRALPSRAAVRSMITAAARRHGVPVSLALALAYQESGFQQGVVSPVDAIGVMQVLPSTGRSLGRAYGRSFDLLKTSDNIEAGIVLLRDLLRATGSTPGALAGYYQGLGSVHEFGLLPQTRQYIANITQLTRRFS